MTTQFPLPLPAYGLDDTFQPATPVHGSGNGSAPAPAPEPAVPAPAREAASPAPRSAGRGYNQLYFEGRLAQDPVLRTWGNNNTYCRVDVLQDQPDRNNQPGTQAVSVLCFNERANRFAERFRKGDYAIFVGRMTVDRRRDPQGQLHINVSLHLDHILGHKPARRSA